MSVMPTLSRIAGSVIRAGSIADSICFPSSVLPASTSVLPSSSFTSTLSGSLSAAIRRCSIALSRFFSA
jgi:hypothetical protein